MKNNLSIEAPRSAKRNLQRREVETVGYKDAPKASAERRQFRLNMLVLLLGLWALGFMDIGADKAAASQAFIEQEAQIHLSDGSTRVATSAAELQAAIESSLDGSISAIVIRGNGPESCSEFFAIGDSDFELRKGLLERKLAERSRIFLNTPKGNETVAESWSQAIPQSVVRGVEGGLHQASTWSGGTLDSANFKYYRNGREVDPTLGGAVSDADSPDLILSHPFTKFS